MYHCRVLLWPADSLLYWCALSAATGVGVLLARRRLRRSAEPRERRRTLRFLGVFFAVALVASFGGSLFGILLEFIDSVSRMDDPVTLAWWGSAAVLGVFALVRIAAWAIGDRARGRRRCPRCWYDMAGVPGLTCPECGRTAKREAALFKTRRRRRWFAAACVLGLCAFASAQWPRVQEDGWERLIPTTVVIIALPWADAGTTIDAAASERLGSSMFGSTFITAESLESLPRWQSRLLAQRGSAMLSNRSDAWGLCMGMQIASATEQRGPTIAVRARELLAHSDDSVRSHAVSLLAESHADRQEVATVLLAALDDPSRMVRSSALFSLSGMAKNSHEPPPLPEKWITVMTEDPDRLPRGAAIRLLDSFARSERAIEALYACIERRRCEDAPISLRTLTRIDAGSPRLHAWLVRTLRGDDADAIKTAADALLSAEEPDPEVLDLLVPAMAHAAAALGPGNGPEVWPPRLWSPPSRRRFLRGATERAVLAASLAGMGDFLTHEEEAALAPLLVETAARATADNAALGEQILSKIQYWPREPVDGQAE